MASVISLNLCGSLGIKNGTSFSGTTSLQSLSSNTTKLKTSCRNFKIVAEANEEKQSVTDKWRGLAFDISDDQQDITRGKGMVDSLFQAPMNTGTHTAIMSSYDYLSTGIRQ